MLLDGWPLVTEWNSPASVHIWELLSAAKLAGIEMRVALPSLAVPTPFKAVIRHTGKDGWGRLLWEQKVLPELARKEKAHLLHSVTGSLPLASPVPCVYSPAGARASGGSGLMDELQESLGRGGYSRLRALFWPEDLPAPPADIPLMKLPPAAHLAFNTSKISLHFRLPDEFVFCPGPLDAATQDRLAEAWRWISTGLGEDWALVIDGVDSYTAAQIRSRSGSTARIIDVHAVAVGTRAALMEKAALVLLVAKPTAWGDPLMQALVSGKPVAAEESDWNARRAGPAAYLTPPGDMRMLGAAVITLAVEESVAAGLSEKALARAKALQSDTFPDRLRQAYLEILG